MSHSPPPQCMTAWSQADWKMHARCPQPCSVAIAAGKSALSRRFTPQPAWPVRPARAGLASAHHAEAQATHPETVTACQGWVCSYSIRREVRTQHGAAPKLNMAMTDTCRTPHSKQAGEGFRRGGEAPQQESALCAMWGTEAIG